MSKINWNGSQRTWRARQAQPGRELLGQTVGNAQRSTGAGALSLTVALVTVAAGSAGAAFLAMSLMSADVPELARDVAEVTVGEAQASEAAAAAAQSGQPAIETAGTNLKEPQTATSAQPEAVAAAEPQAAEPAGETDVAALNSSDPRWAQFAKPAPPLEELRNDADASNASAFGSAGQSAGALAAVNRAIQDPGDEPGQDDQQTAAITPPPRVADPKAEAAGRQIVLNTAANMRSSANKSGRIVGTVPAGVKVASFGCRSSWCEVSYKGNRGWVYSGFVTGGGKNQSAGETKRQATKASGQRQKLAVKPVAKSKADGALPGVKTGEPLPTAKLYEDSGR